jgi:hypothetical protein
MKGLEIAHRFFNEWGLPYLNREFPMISDRIAAFLCGGSQSLGNDDELSRDHGWGPGFSLVVTGLDMRQHGARLRRALKADAPTDWLGFTHGRQANIEVTSLDRWFRERIGCAHPPRRPLDWIRRTNENALYMLRHATVFYDPLGEFTARRESFRYYPKAAWWQRLEAVTFGVWHYGQYNFLTRLTQRRDPIAVATCLGMFTTSTMVLCLLLAEDYSPYWKWLPAEFRKLPDIDDLESHLTKLSLSRDIDVQVEHVEWICEDVLSRLKAKGVVSANPIGHRHPLMCALNEIKSTRESLR